MRLAAAVWLTWVTAAAQVAPPAVPGGPPGATGASQTKPGDLCVVQGHISSAAGGVALKKAVVTLNRIDTAPNIGEMPRTYSGSTDAAGAYAISGVEPGRYRSSAKRNGYVSATYGARGPGRPGITLSLNRGQTQKEIDFRLIPQAVVAGRILDEDGDPVQGAIVQLFRPQYTRGGRQWAVEGSVATNDLGEYRVFGLAPGKYFMSATVPFRGAEVQVMGGGAALGMATADDGDEEFVATYYPGTPDSSAAAPLDVLAGAQMSGIGLTLSKTRTQHVRGRVANNTGGRGRVRVTLVARTEGAGMLAGARSAAADAKGAFDLRGVTPGAYSLVAMTTSSGANFSASIDVDVVSSDVENVNLAINPGVTVEGTVRMEGDAPQELARVFVRLAPRNGRAAFFGGGGTGQVKPDGTFTLSSTGADLFDVVVFGLPQGCYVKSLRAGATDVQAAGLDLAKGAPKSLEISISPHAATVSGAVTDAAGKPAQGATVVLIPQEKERSGKPEYYRTATADQNGAFTLASVVPGDYKAFAWEDLEPGGYFDPDVVKQADDKSTAVAVKEGDRQSVTLKAIPAADGVPGV